MSTVSTTKTATWNVQDTVTSIKTATWPVQAQVTKIGTASWDIDLPWMSVPTCPPVPDASLVWRRIKVSNIFSGGAKIAWEFDRHFIDPGTYTYQLQASQAGVETADDWINIGGPQQNVFFLSDPNQRMRGKTATLHYRIQLTTGVGTYYSPVAPVLGLMDEHGYLATLEIIRKEELRHRIFGSVRGWLLKARRYGTVCSCVDPDSGEIRNSQDPVCFGTGWVNGYYGAVTCTYADISPEKVREHVNPQMVGTDKPDVISGRLLGFPPLDALDVFVAADSDDRYYLHSIEEKAIWKSVPIIYEAELRKAPYSDVAYTIPLS